MFSVFDDDKKCALMGGYFERVSSTKNIPL